MIVLVTGSRGWTNSIVVSEALRDVVHYAHAEFSEPVHSITLRHGNARGADRMAATIARQMGMVLDPMDADWYVNGVFDPVAGLRRNIAMLDKDPRPDLVIAFWDGSSRGTKHTIDEAHKRDIKTIVYQLG